MSWWKIGNDRYLIKQLYNKLGLEVYTKRSNVFNDIHPKTSFCFL